MSRLLSRFASNLFWLARYMERAENLARILQVNESFARDRLGARDWLPILQLNDDEERFFKIHNEASADNVVHFYLLDRKNPTSIIASVHQARENARALRHLISTEMWTQVNVFHGRLTGLRSKDLALEKLSLVCSEVKESCQAHAGITEGTYYRDEGWHFYNLGRYLERADQTSRLLDIKYRRPSLDIAPSTEDPASDASLWNTLLRSGAGYHAFRRVHPRGMIAADVLRFFLCDPAFPRSITTCVRELEELVAELQREYGLTASTDIKEKLKELNRLACQPTDDEDRGDHVNRLMDRIQFLLVELSNAIDAQFFH
ncbi:alpha-E domain-containing protein [Limibacillus halophilus]|uniref:Putative alpha-E superfamily protein n=1 Tax=Limibacillus halophilus TaxID=1579333 RepID=A0A839SSI9_9PROT|nr:alpha-E domain-containing protein [Limibacillus halophilus]MBB3065288.1 putative alpha-E superfamily protein [Limibacillus halophilus]